MAHTERTKMCQLICFTQQNERTPEPFSDQELRMNTDNTLGCVLYVCVCVSCLIQQLAQLWSVEQVQGLQRIVTSYAFAPMCILASPDLTHCNQLQGNEIQSRPGLFCFLFHWCSCDCICEQTVHGVKCCRVEYIQ